MSIRSKIGQAKLCSIYFLSLRCHQWMPQKVAHPKYWHSSVASFRVWKPWVRLWLVLTSGTNTPSPNPKSDLDNGLRIRSLQSHSKVWKSANVAWISSEWTLLMVWVWSVSIGVSWILIIAIVYLTKRSASFWFQAAGPMRLAVDTLLKLLRSFLVECVGRMGNSVSVLVGWC